MKTIYVFFIAILLVNCATKKIQTTTKLSEESNNLIVEKNKGKVKGTGGGNTQIIFEGKNNIFEIIRENTSYFNSQGGKDVIVIKGDGNHITLYNRSSVDLGGFSEDTLVFVGQNERYVMLPDHQVKFTKDVKIDTVQMTTPEVVFIEENINPESENNSDVSYYADEIKKGNQDAYYELAEIYNYGLNGVVQNFKQAIQLYEHGAVKNNIASITRLGDLWYNGHWEMKKNKTIGLYYYKRGAELGSEYCQQMVQKMMNH